MSCSFRLSARAETTVLSLVPRTTRPGVTDLVSSMSCSSDRKMFCATSDPYPAFEYFDGTLNSTVTTSDSTTAFAVNRPKATIKVATIVVRSISDSPPRHNDYLPVLYQLQGAAAIGYGR